MTSPLKTHPVNNKNAPNAQITGFAGCTSCYNTEKPTIQTITTRVINAQPLPLWLRAGTHHMMQSHRNNQQRHHESKHRVWGGEDHTALAPNAASWCACIADAVSSMRIIHSTAQQARTIRVSCCPLHLHSDDGGLMVLEECMMCSAK